MNNNMSADDFYVEMTKKNIGVYSQEEQNKLRASKIIIFGLGGVGGLEAILCRVTGKAGWSGAANGLRKVQPVRLRAVSASRTAAPGKIDPIGGMAPARHPGPLKEQHSTSKPVFEQGWRRQI